MVKVVDIKILQKQEKTLENGTTVIKNIVFKREIYDDGTSADIGVLDIGVAEQPEQVIVDEPKPKSKPKKEEDFDDGLDDFDDEEDDDDEFEDEDDDEEPEEEKPKKKARKKKFL